jgi:hypothetical protein
VTDSPAPRRRRRLANLGLLIGSLLLCLVLTEITLRLFFKDWLYLVEDEKRLMYHYDETLGWFPKANKGMLLVGSRPFTVIHNSWGFRDIEHQLSGTKPRIAFIGDSFVWGYDVNADERFTDKLQARHPEWEIFNLGVSGYGTDQEYLLLQKYFDDFKPNVVFLMFCTDTDDADNCANVRYGRYYKPYVTLEGTHLQLKGIPVPRGERVFYSEHDLLSKSALIRLLARTYSDWHNPPSIIVPNPTGAIIRDLQKFVQSKGALLVVGLERTHPKLQEFLAYFKIPFVDVTTALTYPTHGGHWTPEGHTYVCDKIERLFRDSLSTNSAPSQPANPAAASVAEPGK